MKQWPHGVRRSGQASLVRGATSVAGVHLRSDRCTPLPPPQCRGGSRRLARTVRTARAQSCGGPISRRAWRVGRFEATTPRDGEAVIVAPPAVPGSLRVLGHRDARRARTGNTSPLGAIAARHTAGRDAASHGPQRSGVASEPTVHQWPYDLLCGCQERPWSSAGRAGVYCFSAPATLAHGDAGISPRVGCTGSRRRTDYPQSPSTAASRSAASPFVSPARAASPSLRSSAVCFSVAGCWRQGASASTRRATPRCRA